MKTIKRITYIAIVCLVVAILALTGCKGGKKKTTTTTDIPVANYVYLKFANVKPTQNSDMLPDGVVGSWLGYYYGSMSTAPANYGLYSWVKIQGSDGVNGKDGKDGVGTPGENGKSAYEIAILEGQTNLTQSEWIESLQGKDGEDGQDGKSAYEIALDNELIPATMTEAEWIVSLRGKDGKDGEDGQSATATAGLKAEVVSIQNSANYNAQVDMRVNADGDAVYMLKLYCVTPPAAGSVVVNWGACSPVNSIPADNKWFVEYGNLATPNSQVVIAVPVAPYFKNFFTAGDRPQIRVSGLSVSLATIEQAMF